MTEQLQRTRTRVLPGQRGAEPATTATSPATAAAPSGWEAHSWVTVVRVGLARAVLATLVMLLVWTLLPLAVGWTPRVILSGSMEPRIHSGDVVVTRPVEPVQLDEGMVVTTVDPDKEDRTRTHRFQQWDDQGRVVTKGDANESADSTPVLTADVLGVGVIRVPYVGLPQYWIAERQTVALGLALAALSGLVLAAWTPRGARSPRGSSGGTGGGGNNRGGGAGNEGESHSSARRSTRRAGRAGTVVTSMLGAVLSVALVAPGSYAAFSGTSQPTASSFTAAAQFAQYAERVLADGPSFFWRMDEQSGDVVSDATANNNGAFTWNARWGQTGAVTTATPNRALGIDGASVEQRSASTIGSVYSIEMWVQTTRTDGGALMSFQSDSSGTHDRVLYLGRDGKVRFSAGSGAAFVTGTSAINDGRWHHVVLTSASSGGSVNQRARLYVDGAQQAIGRTVDTSVRGKWRAGQATWNGQVDGTPDQYFRGNLDEVAVYPTVLSAARVLDHYRAAGY